MILDPETILQARIGAYAAGAGTHLPLLASVIAIARPGGVFEIGTGHCSAPLVAEMCRAMGRDWHVADHDMTWLHNVDDLAPLARYELLSPVSLDMTPTPWAVVFIDSSPPLDRLSVLQKLRGHAEFFVIHDTDNQGGDLADLLEYFKTFPHRYDYTRMRPWTTVVSDTRAYPCAR